VPNVTPLRADDPDRIGRYRLAGRLDGMPGTGPFYLAAAPEGPELAVRLLRGAWTHDPAARDRFAAEAASARRVPPFCAARIVDFGAEDDYAFLVSEYIAGRSLLEVVEDSGRLRGLELEALAIGGATGLAAVHQAGLVHGGFGPGHLILSTSGPRVIEFGITPPYGQATPAADMLAWAQTLVFAATGRPPSALGDLAALPGGLRDLVGDCLSGDPGDRPEARDVTAELLGEGAPAAGLLAEGSRRTAQLTEAARRAAAEREDRLARPDGSGQGRRTRPRPDRPGGSRRAGGPPAGESGRRVPVIPVVLAVVLTLVIAVVVVKVVTGGSGGPPAASPGGPSTSPVSSTDRASPAASPTVPAAFAGAWQGSVQQQGPGGVALQVRIDLTEGAPKGTISYSGAGGFACSGELDVNAARGSTLSLAQGIITGQKACFNGTVTLTGGGSASALSFTFRGAGAPPITGTLGRG
jgi:hypothetical protein